MNLTIDTDVYTRCKELSRTLGINWSLIAEQTFRGLIAQVDEMQSLINNAKDSGQSTELIKAVLTAHVQKAYAELASEIDNLDAK